MSHACRGRIVWLELDDPQGENKKCRPAVILTATDEIEPAGDILVAAISTKFEDSPPEAYVALPWEPSGRPHPKTRLKEPCGVVCTWLAQVSLREVKEYAGVVPGKQLMEILRKVNMLPPSR